MKTISLGLIGIIAVQQLPMAFAGGRSASGRSARPVKGTRGGASSFSVRKLQDLSTDDPEDSGAELKKNSVKGPSKRDCKMCKFQLYDIFVYSVSVPLVS
jgi:hypothetical protein